MESPLGHEASSRFQKIDKSILLAQCPLFSGLSPWELRSISQMMRLVEYKRDELVYREGEEGESFYVIVSGRFEAYVAGGTEKKKILAYLKRGDYFGEMSLLTDQPHSASLRALSDSLVLEIKKEGFKRSIEHNATISLELSRRLSSRLKVHDSRSRSLFKSDVISIYGPQAKDDRGFFAMNLASSLVSETHQKTVLVDLSSSDNESPSIGERVDKAALSELQNVETLSSEELKKLLVRHSAGFDTISLRCDVKSRDADEILISFLNQLAIDFRFVLVDLSPDLSESGLKVISQSDTLFIASDSHLNNLTEAKEALRNISRSLAFPEEKMAVMIREVAFGAHTTPSLRQELFGKIRCFSAPASAEGERTDEYFRMMRHMARFLGGNLVGLALGSGAALGLAHIGVLKALDREKIPVDIVAGSSVGALIGSLYAVGLSALEIEQAAMEINLRLLATRLVDVSLFPVRGLMHGNQVIKHFRKHLGNKTFDQCRIPLKITGANLSTRESIVFDSGFVADAVRASIAIPAIIKPVIRPDRNVIVDGGILNPLPVQALHDAGANKVIAVNVFPGTKDMIERRLMAEESLDKEKGAAKQRGFLARGLFWAKRSWMNSFTPNIFDILMNTIQAMEAEIAEVQGETSDVLLRPVLANANWVDFYKPEAFIRRGEEEVMKALPKIRSLVFQQHA